MPLYNALINYKFPLVFWFSEYIYNNNKIVPRILNVVRYRKVVDDDQSKYNNIN